MISQQLLRIKQGLYIDAKDKHNDWQCALILEANKTVIRVRFDGWSSRLDQIFSINSQKIKPFRTMVRGYSGQRKKFGIRQHFHFTVDKHRQKLSQFQNFINHITQKKAFEITQYLRGQNYFYIDFLMTLTYNKIDQFIRVFKYFQQHIEFAKNYMKQIMKKDRKKWLENQQNQNKSENQANKAFYSIHYQLFDSVYSIIGAQQRLYNFFKINQLIIRQFIAPEITYENYIIKYLIKTQFLKTYQQLIQKIYTESCRGIKLVSFPFLSSYMWFFSGLQRMSIDKWLRQSIFKKLLLVLRFYYAQLTTAEVKIEEREINQILNWTKILANKLLSDKEEKVEIVRWTQYSRLRLWKLLIECDVLEKKLKGIFKLKQFYDQVSNHTLTSSQTLSILCTQQDFGKWLQKQEMYKILFQTNQHSQVIKKSCEMIQFFYATNVCSMSQLIFIWQTCFKKHQAIRKIIFQQWIEMAQYINRQNDWSIFVGVLTQNQQRINEDWQIQALFRFLNAAKQDGQNPPLNSLISMLYRKTFYNQKYIEQFARQVSYFQGKSSIIRQTVDKCLLMINQKIQAVFHLKLLSKLFRQMLNKQMYVPQNIIEVLIYQLRQLVCMDQNQKLISSIFQLFNEIISARDSLSNNSTKESGSSQTLSIVQKNKINLNHFQQIWKLFVGLKSNSLKRIFYNWVASRQYNSLYNNSVYNINPRFSSQFRTEIFTFLCKNIDYQNIEPYQFYIFRQLLFNINSRINTFQIKYFGNGSGNAANNRRYIKVKFKEINGLPQLWKIFMNCRNQEVINSTCSLLKDLHLRPHPQMLNQEKLQRIRSLMQRIQSYITQGRNNSNLLLINHCIILITKLIMDIKQKIDIPKQFQRMPRTQKITLKIFNTQIQYYLLQIYHEDSFLRIKDLISQKHDIPKQDIIISTMKNIQIPKQALDIPYYLFGFDVSSFRIRKIDAESNKYIKQVISYVYQKFVKMFIQFLKNDQLCTAAFQMLDYLQIMNPVQLMNELSPFIEGVQEIIKNKKRIYLHIYFIRVMNNVLEREKQFWFQNILKKLISHLQIPIQNNMIVSYLNKLIQTFALLIGTGHPAFSFNKIQIQSQQNQHANVDYRQKIYKLVLNIVKYINGNSSNASNLTMKLYNQSLKLYKNGFDNVALMFDSFIKDKHFKQLMIEVFIKCQFNQIKKQMENLIIASLKLGFIDPAQQSKVSLFFIQQLYIQIYRGSITKPLNSDSLVLFRVLKSLLQTIGFQTFFEIVFVTNLQLLEMPFAEHIYQQLHQQSDTQNEINYLLNGILNILVVILKRNRAIITQQLVQYILYQCLIYTPKKTQHIDVKCLSRQNINAVLEILLNIVVDCQINQNQSDKVAYLNISNLAVKILTELKQYHYFQIWRNSKDWSLEFQPLTKIKNDFVGLENPGCICYLNSLIQQLYMIEDFRYSVLAVQKQQNTNQIQIQTPTPEDSPELLPKLKLLFLNLQYSQKNSFQPLIFTNSIRNAANRPMVKIFQQMDIDQFSMILFDKIESKLHRMKYPNFIRNLFGGAYSNEIISQQCKHSSQRQQQFLSISLEVKKNIVESFQSLVKGQMLEGQNAYFCQRCDKKVKALKRLSIKKLPPYLIISLRRFEFDYQIDQKIKINKFCQFPLQLNLQNYSQDKLNQNTNHLQRDRLSQQHIEKTKNKTFSTDYYIYKLKGVVIHSGSADSGHYYSFIQSNDGNWFQFNDEKVSPFDIRNLQEEAFGGKDGQYSRIKNAYLLFYERKVKNCFNNSQLNKFETHHHNRIPEQMSIQAPTSYQQHDNNHQQYNYTHQNQLQSNSFAFNKQNTLLLRNKQIALSLQQNKQIIENIVTENKRMKVFQLFFSKEYYSFVANFYKKVIYRIFNMQEDAAIQKYTHYDKLINLQNANRIQCINQSELQNQKCLMEEMFRFFMSYVFLIILRNKNYFNSIQILKMIQEVYFEKSIHRRDFIQLFLQNINTEPFITQFFIECFQRQKTKIVSHFIYQNLQNYLIMCRQDNEQCLPSLVKKFIKLIVKATIVNNYNIVELIFIIRRLISSRKLRQICPFYVKEIVCLLFQTDFVNLIINNAFGTTMSKQAISLRIQMLENDNFFVYESEKKKNSQKFLSQSQQQKKDNLLSSQNKANSDISAASNEINNQSPNYKRSNNLQIQIQMEQKKTLTFIPDLFGFYKPEGVKSFKNQEKQTWTLLYILYKLVKENKPKQVIEQSEGQLSKKNQQVDNSSKQQNNFKSNTVVVIKKIEQQQNSANKQNNSNQSYSQNQMNPTLQQSRNPTGALRESSEQQILSQSRSSFRPPPPSYQSLNTVNEQQRKQQVQNTLIGQGGQYETDEFVQSGEEFLEGDSQCYSQYSSSIVIIQPKSQIQHQVQHPSENSLINDQGSNNQNINSNTNLNDNNAVSQNNIQEDNNNQAHQNQQQNRNYATCQNNFVNQNNSVIISSDQEDKSNRNKQNSMAKNEVQANEPNQNNDKNSQEIAKLNINKISEIKLTTSTNNIPENKNHQTSFQQFFSPQQFKMFQQTIRRFYITCLKFPTQKLTKLIAEQKDIRSIIAFSQLVSNMMTNNKTFTQLVINAAAIAFKDYQSMKYRPFFILVEKMILIQDNFSQTRRIQIVTILKQALRYNDKYFLEVDFIHQWFLRYSTICKQFYAILHANTSFVNQLKLWSIKRNSPGLQTIKKHRQPNCERMLFKLHGIIVGTDMKQYETLSKYKAQSFQKIKQNTFVSLIKYSKEPGIMDEYQKDQIIQCYNFNEQPGSWVPGKVQNTYYGFICATFCSKNINETILFIQDEQKIKIKHNANMRKASNPQIQIEK